MLGSGVEPDLVPLDKGISELDSEGFHGSRQV